MSEKILIISASQRKNGNSETLAKEFGKGAAQAGNDVEYIYLRDLDMNYCRGCLACQTTHKCVMDDGVTANINKVRDADVLVFATPIYYYAMCGRLKNFLDRLNPLYGSSYNFSKVYLITAAADEERPAMEIITREIEGWASCFNGVELARSICAYETNLVGDINNKPELIKEAFEMGRQA